MAEDARIDIEIRLTMERARREARQVQSFLANMAKAAQQTGQTGAAGIERLERAIQDLNYSTTAGFDAMADASQRFDRGLAETRDNTDKLLSSYVDYRALAMDLADSAGQIGAMGEEAAQRRDVAESFDFLAERANLSGREIVSAMQAASKGTVDANTIMATSNMVLGARFKTSSEDMAKMMEFARLKSKEYGVSVTSAFQRMTTGAVKAEVEFLDEYGITIKLNDALKMYAERLGKGVSALTSAERSQALWNALLIQADDQLAAFPDGVDKSTDAYERMRIKVLSVTQAVGDFLDRSKIGPVMSIAAQAVQGLSAVMTPLILAKQMAAQASAAHAAALTKETAALAKQAGAAQGAAGATGARGLLSKIPISGAGLAAAAPAAAGLGIAAGAGIAVYKKHQEFQKTLDEGNEKAAQGWNKHEVSLRSMMDAGESAVDIAREHAQAQAKVSGELYKSGGAITNLTAAIIRNNVNEQELINAKNKETAQIVTLASKSYPQYLEAIEALNTDLPKGALATTMLTESQYKLEKALDAANKMTDDAREKFKALSDAYREAAQESSGLARLTLAAQSKMYEGLEEIADRNMKKVADATKLAQETLKGMGLETDVLTAKMAVFDEELSVTEQEAKNAKDAFTLLTQGFGLGVVGAERYKEALEQAAAGTLELTRAERMYIEVAQSNLRSALTGADATRALGEAVKQYGVDQEHARQVQEALSVGIGETTWQQIENRKELTLLAQGLALGTVSQERYLAAIEDVKDGTLELSAAEREAIMVANQRAQATQLQADHMDELRAIQAKYQDQATSTTESYQASQEQNARQHAQRVEDIERQHRQRLAEIERNYNRAVEEGAIARDAIAILSARERRDEELSEAERARQEGRAGEDRSYAETNRQAAESYAQRIAEIDRMRQEEVSRANVAYQAESEALRQQQADAVAQIQEAQTIQTQIAVREALARAEAEKEAVAQKRQAEFDAAEAQMNENNTVTVNAYANDAARVTSAQQAAEAIKQAYITAWAQIKATWGGGSVGGTRRPSLGRARGRNMQHGGAGMVSGPASFYVEPGAREFVAFGGDERRMAPSSMRVGGGVDLNVTSQLGQMAGPLAERIAQTLMPRIDSFLADSVMEALG